MLNIGNLEISNADILMLTADINYTYVHLVCGKVYIVTKTIKRFEEMLKGQGFIRVNRSVIVNVLFIVNHTGKEIKLTNGEVIKIPRRKQVSVSSTKPK